MQQLLLINSQIKDKVQEVEQQLLLIQKEVLKIQYLFQRHLEKEIFQFLNLEDIMIEEIYQ